MEFSASIASLCRVVINKFWIKVKPSEQIIGTECPRCVVNKET